MFILDKSKFADSDPANAKEFVEFWSNYYKYKEDDESRYIKELNLNNDLTKENVKILLSWKDPLRLAEKIGGEKRDNDKVLRVLNKLEDINNFRNGKISENNFENKLTNDVFPNGFIWNIFLFHIARPYEYPIADQYVFQAFKILNKKEKTPENFNDYKEEYRRFFFDVAKLAGFVIEEPKGNENNISDIVKRLKEVDNALFEFGKFLKNYNQ